MKIAGSILDIKEKTKVIDFCNSGIDYVHVDVMDGMFVKNTSLNFIEYAELLENVDLPIDVHLMVADVYKYIDLFVNLKPEFITIHYETNNDILELIKYIKSFNIKAGIALKPNTKIKEINYLLNEVDLVLLMSVEPGIGGQTFMNSTLPKIEELKSYPNTFLIEVDGGINETNITSISVDIVVVGSYIAYSDDYLKQVLKLKELI